MSQSKTEIFKSSSTTYFYSSIFFPRKIWSKVATLYAYVRTADDFVDEQPQDPVGFSKFVQETIYWLKFYNQKDYLEDGFIDKMLQFPRTEHTQIIRAFVELFFVTGMKAEWLIAFLNAMQSDISSNNDKIIYETRSQLKKYIFGSAEVIGLFMSKILKLPKEAYSAAQLQGAAMQHINFIRDITEDCDLGRQYLPKESLEKFGLSNICLKKINSKNKEQFASFIRSEIELYKQTQLRAEEGYKYIPYRYRVPIATAAQLYLWTANQIYQKPEIVFQKKVKPTKLLVFITLFKLMLREMIRG